MTRPGWDDYFIQIAQAVAARADCTRRQVGAVIVDQDHRIVSTGYNGAPSGHLGCLAGHCPRGRHHKVRVPFFVTTNAHGGTADQGMDECACGNDWPCPDAEAEYSAYDNCVALHAELNAIVYAGRSACSGTTLYITDDPCDGCKKVIHAADIARVKTPTLRWNIWPVVLFDTDYDR